MSKLWLKEDLEQNVIQKHIFIFATPQQQKLL